VIAGESHVRGEGEKGLQRERGGRREMMMLGKGNVRGLVMVG